MEGTRPVKWNLRLAAANRGIWKASELQRGLAEHGLVISVGKMSGLWSGEPASSNGIVPSLFTAGMSEEDAQARATSSITMAVARASAPAPPYSCGMCGAWKSAARRAS